MTEAHPRYAIVGGLREDYFITHSNEVHLRKIGGNAVYAAVGAALWDKRIGIISRVGENYPADWIVQFAATGFDTRGINIVRGWHDTRTFYAYLNLEERVDTNPAGHFARIGQPLPPPLKDYSTSTAGQDEVQIFTPLAVRPADIPQDFKYVRGMHLAPCEYITQRTLPEAMRLEGVRKVTCDPSLRYMQPALRNEVASVVRGLDAFMPSEAEVFSYYRSDKIDLWEAAAEFGGMGCRSVVIKRGANGAFVYHADTGNRWHVPAYPANVRNVTGAGDAFCGGFIVGLCETDDPVEAALRGAVSASIVVEAPGALSGLEALPALAEARLARLRDSVRKM